MYSEMFERMMPNQILDYYQGDKDDKREIAKRIYERCCRYSRADEVESFSLSFPPEFPGQQYMGADPVARRFQQIMIGLLGAKRILEIGTFVGASTMSMGKMVGEDGHVWSIEKYDKFAKIARQNFADNDVKNITLIEGDAFEILSKPIEFSTNMDVVYNGGG